MLKLSFNKLLFGFFFFICSLIFVRIFYSESGRYLFLIWNIFLAAVPYLLAQQFEKVNFTKAMKILLLFCCILFLPNAFYIITDLIHLRSNTAFPIWFDAVLLFSAALIGLIFAFATILKIENYLLQFYSKSKTSFFISGILFLSCFCVYLGRFLRFNSWDVVKNPTSLFIQIADRFIAPHVHLRTWSVTIILFCLFYFLFLIIKKLNREFMYKSTTPMKLINDQMPGQ